MFSFIFSAFSVVKGFFSSDNPNSTHNRLTAILIAGLVVFIVVLFGLNFLGKKDREELAAKQAVAQQQAQIAEQKNAELKKTIIQQQKTTEDAVKAVDQDIQKKQENRQETKKIITVKHDKIALIKQQAEKQITQTTPLVEQEQIKKEEQNQISLVQIQSIWQAYCTTAPQGSCPQTSS